MYNERSTAIADCFGGGDGDVSWEFGELRHERVFVVLLGTGLLTL